MKRIAFAGLLAFFALLILPRAGFAQATLPLPVGEVVNDFAGVLNAAQASEMKSLLKRVESQAGVEITLVTINSLKDFNHTPETVNEFSTSLFNRWGVGHASVNNGVLILLAVKDGLLRFEFGSDYDRDDIRSLQDSIHQHVMPLFATQAHFEGLNASALYTIQTVTVPVSFFSFHKKGIRWGVFALGALILCLHFYSIRKPILMWVFFGLTGAFLVLTVVSANRNAAVKGFGGGATDGLGFTEKWPNL